MKYFIISILLFCQININAQIKPKTNTLPKPYTSKVWVSDNGDGTYKNPIINADYSDPDVIRVGNDFYMIASSFNAAPGLPILHSKDLVNWTIIAHALPHQIPFSYFAKTQHGGGVWAPALRFHNKEFYIYYPDPDFGIYLTKAKSINGPWSSPILVQEGKGLIDPCPFWDDDGNAYLIHAFAGSRAGIKSVLVIKKMNANGTSILDDGVLVYDGHEIDPTIEGPKIYKRNNYYYIFAPAGGVGIGWQIVLRSKNIYGPYDRKIVLQQGSSKINGPHQGAWINTPTGEDWFIHFQDKDAYGRVVHLQPMHWKNEWPIIGIEKVNDGIGEPVLEYKKPNVGKSYAICSPQETDEFNDTKLGLQWQWQANPQPNWAFLNAANGTLRMYSCLLADSTKNYWELPNMLLQKFPAEKFTITTKFNFKPRQINEKFGLIIMGLNYAYLGITKKATGNYLSYFVCKDADKANTEVELPISRMDSSTIYFRIKIEKGAVATFAFSADGNSFTEISEKFNATVGKWIGTKMGYFITKNTKTNDSGFVDIDWFRVTATEE